MKNRLIHFVFAIFFLIGCTNREGEIIDLINSIKKQNDDLKAQITALKKTTDSALVAVLKVNSLQVTTDKKIDLIQSDLKSLLTQIASLTTQMTSVNADLVTLKAKIDVLQATCAELVAQIATLTPGGNLKNGLVAYYPFNGNANDVSGSSNNGTVYGAQLTTDRFGNSNKSYNFNGTSDYIVAKTPSINNILSISFWVNEIDQKVTSSSVNPRYISAEICNGGFAIWKNILDSPKGLNFTTNRGGKDYFSNLITNKNTWQLITIVFNGNICFFYINDKLVGNLNGTSTIEKGENLFIAKSGCSNIGISDFFSGKIDDIGVWNRALTAEEIKFLYENDFKP